MKRVTADIYVIGCGNKLFGDDGFGSEVVDHLEREYDFGKNVAIIDAGTAVRKFLFDFILAETRPKKVIIVDCVDFGKEAGTIFEIPVSRTASGKTVNLSLHQSPTISMLKELKEFCDVDVTVVACQAENLPGEVYPYLSETVARAIPEACERICRMIKEG